MTWFEELNTYILQNKTSAELILYVTKQGFTNFFRCVPRTNYMQSNMLDSEDYTMSKMVPDPFRNSLVVKTDK